MDFLEWKCMNFEYSFIEFAPSGPTVNILGLVQIIAWRRPVDKSLSEPVMVSLPNHICVTRPQWVNWIDMILWYIMSAEYDKNDKKYECHPVIRIVAQWLICGVGFRHQKPSEARDRFTWCRNNCHWSIAHCGPVMSDGKLELGQRCS